MHWHIHNKQAAIWFPRFLWLFEKFVKMLSQRAEIELNPVEYREEEAEEEWTIVLMSVSLFRNIDFVNKNLFRQVLFELK